MYSIQCIQFCQIYQVPSRDTGVLDLRRTSTLLGKLSRDAEVFFSEGNVAKATLPEEKAVMRPGSLSGVAGILRKLSVCFIWNAAQGLGLI